MWTPTIRQHHSRPVTRYQTDLLPIRRNPVLGDRLLRRPQLQRPSADHLAKLRLQAILRLGIPLRLDAARLRPQVRRVVSTAQANARDYGQSRERSVRSSEDLSDLSRR